MATKILIEVADNCVDQNRFKISLIDTKNCEFIQSTEPHTLGGMIGLVIQWIQEGKVSR